MKPYSLAGEYKRRTLQEYRDRSPARFDDSDSDIDDFGIKFSPKSSSTHLSVAGSSSNFENESYRERLSGPSTPECSPSKNHKIKESAIRGEKSEECEEFSSKNYIIIAVLAILLIIFAWYYMRPRQPDDTTIFGLFEQGIHKVRSRFQHQDNSSWNIISAAVKPIMEESNPNQPAVILFFGIDSDAKTIDCLVKQIGNIINEAFNATQPVILHGSKFEKTDPDEAKELVDDTLKQGFESKSRVAVLYNINKMPTETMMMLHSYCDNENAPYKDRVILLTVLAQKNEVKDKLTSSDVEKYLENVWSDRFDMDKISPLLSRIGNSIAIIKSEPYEILQC